MVRFNTVFGNRRIFFLVVVKCASCLLTSSLAFVLSGQRILSQSLRPYNITDLSTGFIYSSALPRKFFSFVLDENKICTLKCFSKLVYSFRSISISHWFPNVFLLNYGDIKAILDCFLILSIFFWTMLSIILLLHPCNFL